MPREPGTEKGGVKAGFKIHTSTGRLSKDHERRIRETMDALSDRTDVFYGSGLDRAGERSPPPSWPSEPRFTSSNRLAKVKPGPRLLRALTESRGSSQA